MAFTLRAWRRGAPALVLLAVTLLVAGCNSGPVGRPEASRAEASRLGAKVYSVELAASNGPAAVRYMHDAWLNIWTTDGPYIGRGQTEILDEQHFSLSGRAQGAWTGQPYFEVHGFLEPVSGQPDRVTINFYRTVVQNPDSGFEQRLSLENAAGSASTRESTVRTMARMLPAIALLFGDPNGPQQISLAMPAPTAATLKLNPPRTAANLAIEAHYASRNLAQLIATAQPLAAAGDPIAQRALGYALAIGTAGRDRMQDGVDWLKRAAAQGDALSEAAMRVNGLGGPLDVVGGVQQMQVEAAAGNLHALYLLGEMAQTGGFWGAPDIVTAAKYYAVAARYGLGAAQQRLDRLPTAAKAAATAYAGQWPQP